MKFDDYALDDSIYDEMFASAGIPHDHCQDLYRTLAETPLDKLGNIQEWITHLFYHEGITFTLYNDDGVTERILPVDCIPRILPAHEWRKLQTGLVQRISALNMFLQDIYGAAKIIEDGVVPADMVFGCPQYREAMRGFQVAHGAWAVICGTDLVRTNEGFKVLEDNLRVPSGVSYMIANRKAVKSGLRRLYRLCRVADVDHYAGLLLQTLQELAPSGKANPNIALLTPGVYNAAFYEHMFLANAIGADLVEGKDLVVKNNHVYARTVHGLKTIDVIYRRIDDDFLDPLVFRADSVLGVPGLMEACRQGHVTLANAPGTGVADDKSVYAFVPDMIRYYLSEEPLLDNVETHLCRRPEGLEYVLDNIENLVVKQVGESGGHGMLIGPHATRSERARYAKRIRANPADFIAQPVLPLSRAPCLIADHIESRHVDLRPFILSGQQTRLVPGAFCRIALKRGSLVVNSSQGGGGKDLWVLND